MYNNIELVNSTQNSKLFNKKRPKLRNENIEEDNIANRYLIPHTVNKKKVTFQLATNVHFIVTQLLLVVDFNE